MKITESKLRQIIREDLAGFLNKTKDIQYSSDSIDPTFDKLPNEEFKPAARAVKQAWAAEANHDFMHDVIKVHWLKFIGTEAQLQRLSNMSGKNEVSTMGYLPESEEFKSKWGPIGIVVQGRTTLAANSMSAIFSGLTGDLSPKIRAKYASSGVPKRALKFSGSSAQQSKAHEYILDRQSFNPQGQGHNEFIVANWKPIGIVMSSGLCKVLTDYAHNNTHNDDMIRIAKLIRDSGLPLFSEQNQHCIENWEESMRQETEIKITEGKLRLIIREELESDIEEAHAGGLGFAYEKDREAESDDAEPQDDEEWQRHVQDRARGAQRYARSGRFKRLAEKHYANLPFPVWTAPYIGNLDDVSTVVDSSRRCYRMNVMDLKTGGKDFLRNHGYKTEDVGNNDLVILYTTGVANSAVMATPWMIIHSIFDSADCADLLAPGYSWISDALVAGGGYTEGGGYNSQTFLKSVAGDYDVSWQGYLTMKSARDTKINSPSDAMAEMMCQELLTSGGLRLDFEGVDENDPVRKDIIWLGKQVKLKAEDFRKKARDKLIVIAVNQGDV